jgi:DNA-binding Xre family transcriptional regulator
MDNTNELRGSIRDALQRNEWTVATLAAHARMPTSTLTRILNGDVKTVRESTLQRLQPYMDVRTPYGGIMAIPAGVFSASCVRVRYVGIPDQAGPGGETIITPEMPQHDGARVMVHDGKSYRYGHLYTLKLVVVEE